MSVFRNPADGSIEAAGAYVAAILDLLDDRDPLDVLTSTPDRLLHLVSTTPPERLTETVRPNQWSAAQVIAHLCDSELVWSIRLRKALAEDSPLLEGYDQDLWAVRLGYELRDASTAAEEFAATRRANLGQLRRMPASALERTGLHAERGPETVAHMIRLYAGHDLVHLAQIERTLNEVER